MHSAGLFEGPSWAPTFCPMSEVFPLAQEARREPFASTNTDDDFDGADAICKIMHDNRQRDNPSDGCSSMKSLANCYTVQQAMNLIPDAPNKQPR